MSVQPGTGYTFTSSSKGTNFSIEKPWSQWCYYPPTEDVCPFTITFAGKTTPSGEDPQYMFSCAPGMVNSIIPQLGIAADDTKRLDKKPTPTTKFNFDEDGYSFIYLKVSADYSDVPTKYPVTVPTDILYPRVISNSVQQLATDDSAFFLLAVAKFDSVSETVGITQITCGSQWSDRIKVGSATARYFFARA